MNFTNVKILPLAVLSGLSLVPNLTHGTLPQTEKDNKPNVLLIYNDDHRYTGIHALGGQAIFTPNIDELFNNGISFSNTFLMGSFSPATCVPSRAMLLTGKQLFHLKEKGHLIPSTDTTIEEAFHEAGYESHIIGKWHQDGASLSRTFDSGGRIMGMGAYLLDHFRMPFWDWNKEGKFEKKDAYLLQYDETGKLFRRAWNKEDVYGPVSYTHLRAHET